MNERSRFDLLHAISMRGSNNRSKKNDEIMTSKKNVQQQKQKQPHPSSVSIRRRMNENIENNNNQLNTSLDILKRAQQEKSLDLYSQGLEQLLKYMKQQKQQSSQLETLRELATVYMSEAETLKQQQQQQKESMTNHNHGLMIPPHLDSTLVHQITSEFLYQTSNTNTNKKSSSTTTTSSSSSSSWEKDIAGLESVKRSLSESFILPLQRPDLFQNHNLRQAPKGILLYGPPGTGKTMCIKAIAASYPSKIILFQCSASVLLSKWMGEGEKLIQTLFAIASSQPNKKCILFCDEMDALFRRRAGGAEEQEASRRFKTEWMVQMDSASSNNLIVMGCTNCPWDIDDAILRRMNRRIYVPLPDRQGRLFLWKQLLQQEPTLLSHNHTLSVLVQKTNGYSCSDITSIAQEAAMIPVRDLFQNNATTTTTKNNNNKEQNIRPMTLSDIVIVISKTKPSVSHITKKQFETWEEENL